MAKKLKKAQAGMSVGQAKEAKRDSLYKVAKAKSDARYVEMMKEMPKVTAPKGKDTIRVGSVRVTVANKKMGGQTKKKKK